jgi:hypothetical protein
MRGNAWRRVLLGVCVTASSLLLSPVFVRGQEAPKPTPSSSPPAEPTAEVRALADSIRELQAQVQALSSQLSELRAEEERAHAEAHELRREVSLTRAQLAHGAGGLNDSDASSALGGADSLLPPNSSGPDGAGREQTPAERIAKLEEEQQLTDAKLNEQYQAKAESGSKYRLRLSGIVLLNVFANRGTVDNQDFPQIATSSQPLDSAGTFGGSLRQSQIGLEIFGPDIAGAHTSAEIKFDFAGGFPDFPNGVAMGVMRLRTGTIRLDWAHTSLVAGQDRLFFAPLAPTSLASLAVPALSYAGNLWSWTPQVRVEHHFDLSEDSSLLFQGGILDSLSGEFPVTDYYRSPTAGEKSGQPAYAARVAWSQRAFGKRWTVGFGGYYGRQNWGFSRRVDSWAGTTDLMLPLGRWFELSGTFYRGRAVGALGGGIGQSVLMTGALTDPATIVQGLDSTGGWAQLKFKPKANFEVNGAFGQDNPFASELGRFSSSGNYYDSLQARNRSSLVNFIYQPRSDVLFSIEYRRLRTVVIDGDLNTANHVNVSLGYVF